MNYRIFAAAALAATLAPFAAHAADSAAPPSAADANARVPAVRYDAAFTGYQPFREQKLAPWREANDEVHKAGGHIGIFGNAPGARAAPAATPNPHSPEHKK
ncbi:MAG: hypothetical protein ABL891_06940 [Burkholderiales bacterium]